MALSCKKGSFAKSTGANGSTQAVTVGFQAKAIIFFWTTQTAEGYTDGNKIGIGFCDATAVDTGNRAVSITSDDNVATSVTERYSSQTRCIRWGTSGGVLEQDSYVSAIDSTSFTLTHSTNQAVATIIHYMAIGGTDITNTDAETFTTPTTAISQSITGLSFQPDFVFMITTKLTNDSATDNASLYIGMATGPTNEGGLAILTEHGRNPMDTWRWLKTDRTLTLLVSTTGAANGEAEFTQFTSTGFDINWTAANDVASLVHFLAIKGGMPFVSNFLAPTSTGVQTYNTITGNIPKGVMMFSVNNSSQSTVQANSRLIISGTDGSSEGGVYTGDNDNITPSVTAIGSLTTKAIFNPGTPAATASTTATNAEADTDSFNSGNFKLSWTSADATAREHLFFAFSEAVGGTNMTEIAAKTYSNKFITKV